MALLKRLSGATLMETMVATVLIMIIFIVTSLLINSIYASSVSGNTQQLTARMNKLEYAYKNDLLTVPYYEDWKEWEISLINKQSKNIRYLVVEAKELKGKRTLKLYSTIEE